MRNSSDNFDLPESIDCELAWQAYLYISGEMSPGDVERFEQRLVEDQAAREAVAEAVDQWSLLASHPPRTVIAAANPRRRTAQIAALTTAAAVVIVGGALSLHKAERPNGAPVSELVALWTDSDSAIEEETNGTASDVGTDEDDLAVPGWMIAALETEGDDEVEEN